MLWERILMVLILDAEYILIYYANRKVYYNFVVYLIFLSIMGCLRSELCIYTTLKFIRFGKNVIESIL